MTGVFHPTAIGETSRSSSSISRPYSVRCKVEHTALGFKLVNIVPGNLQFDARGFQSQPQYFPQPFGQSFRHPLEAEVVGMRAIHQTVHTGGA
jgi:hypothetical protein